ncbi:sensor histidine kinase [Amycolatopsis aidingensis]|uniref:sensor histidine kinase n=1 Tax=Amycolatopsis aidingensis TaxID=2842453 RepID=UPI001C0DF625|nr:ATP-binding protein [Amycolatopsis aidingensis]
MRFATVGPVAAIALLRVSPEHRAATAGVVIVVVAWSGMYVWWLLRWRGRWLVVVDAAVLVGVCVSTMWTEAVEQGNWGWIRLLVTFACIAYQWHTTLLWGAVVTTLAGGALVAVVAMADGPAGLDVTGTAWVGVAAVLSRLTLVLVQRGARAADDMAATAEEARRTQQVATAVRADERDLANALHDAAATTLLMVGTGTIPRNAGWLVPQARRDLDMLNTYGEQAPDQWDLVQRLKTDLAAVPLPVEIDAPARLVLPSPVGRCMAGAAREAVNNVVRHADATKAEVRIHGDSQQLRLEVIDDGTGFAVADVPATKRGLRECVVGRINRIGGTAQIMSSPGVGTVVRLEWHGD